MASPENMEVEKTEETKVAFDQKMQEEKDDNEWLKKVSEEVQTNVISLLSAAKEGSKPFDDCLEILLLNEKKHRKNDEMENTMFTVLKTAELCHHFKQWKLLEEQIASFARRHGQFKEVIQKLVQTCVNYLDDTPDVDTKLSLMDALLAVAEGKIYLELERARLTMQKCSVIENDKGDVIAAADVIKDLQVETYGSIERREKTQYILEQMRVFLACRDPAFFIRAKIRSNHIGPKTLAAFPDLALKYHEYQLEIHHQEEDYLEMTKALLKARELAENQKEKDGVASEAVIACILAPYSEEQHKLLQSLNKDSTIEEIPFCKKLLHLFTTYEIIVWPFEDNAVFGFVENFSFSTKYGSSDSNLELFHTRTVQHNIRVVAKYYTDIQMNRLATFLNVGIEEMEKYLSEMVVAGEVHAKIDRLEQSIRFKKKPSPQEIVSNWGDNVDSLVHKIENTCHEIHRETMVEKARKAKEKAARRKAKRRKQ